jgi:hypothetical protein
MEKLKYMFKPYYVINHILNNMNDQSLYKNVRPKIFRDQDYNRKEQFLPTRGRSAWSHTPSTTCEIFWTKTKGRPGPRPFHILTSRERMFGTTCAPAAALHVLVPPASRLACFTPQSPLATSRRNSSVVEPLPRSAVMTPAGLFAAAVLAAVASLAAHVALNCPIEPIPSPPAPDSRHAPNNLLQVNSEQICRLKYPPILQRTSFARLRKLNCCARAAGWRSWAKGCWMHRRTCTWTRRALHRDEGRVASADAPWQRVVVGAVVVRRRHGAARDHAVRRRHHARLRRGQGASVIRS